MRYVPHPIIPIIVILGVAIGNSSKRHMPGCDVKIAPFSLFFIVKNMGRYSLSWIVSLAYLLLSLREASTKSCSEIRSEILRDADCGTLLNNIERGSVPEPEIFAMHRACASSDCRKNMDDYMQHKSCESVSV